LVSSPNDLSQAKVEDVRGRVVGHDGTAPFRVNGEVERVSDLD
jgi:hypothetical protein